MRKAFLCSAALVLLLLTCTVQAAQDRVIFGVFPYVTASQLMKFHQPLRQRIEKTLGQEVTMVTAPNFKEFVERTHRGEYDIIMTAPHLGWLAESRDGYVHLAGTQHNVQGVFLVRKESDIHKLEDLKNKSVVIGAPSSVIYQMANSELNKVGLFNGKNITIKTTRTHNNAMYAPVRGESDASLTGILLWQKLGKKFKDKMRVLHYTPAIPGFMLLASNRLPASTIRRVQDSLVSFRTTSDGQTYLQATGLRGFAVIDESVRRSMQTYLEFAK